MEPLPSIFLCLHSHLSPLIAAKLLPSMTQHNVPARLSTAKRGLELIVVFPVFLIVQVSLADFIVQKSSVYFIVVGD